MKEVLYVVPRTWGAWFAGGFSTCAMRGDPSTLAKSLVFTVLSLLVIGVEWGEIAAQRLEGEEEHAS